MKDKRQWSPLSNTTNAASNSPQIGLMNDLPDYEVPHACWQQILLRCYIGKTDMVTIDGINVSQVVTSI